MWPEVKQMDFKKEMYAYKDAMLSDLKTLCQIPSTMDTEHASEGAPFGPACREALDAMLAIGTRDGFETDDCDGYAGAIFIGEGDEDFGILGHLDVVPANMTGWDYPQYDCTLDGDMLYGRGVADDKGPLLAAYYAAKFVNTLDIDTRYRVRVIFGCNEENGSKCVEHYFKHRPYPAMGFTPDAEFPVAYGEKGISQYVLTGSGLTGDILAIDAGTQVNVVPETAVAKVTLAKDTLEESFNAFLNENPVAGTLSAEGNTTVITVVGKSAHGSMPEDGINALVYLCHYLNSVTDNAIVKAMDENFFEDVNGEKFGVGYTGVMGATSLNAGVVHADTNSIFLELDIRYSSELTEDAVEEKAQAFAKPLGLTCDHTFAHPLYIDPESELITKLQGAYVAISGDTENGPMYMGGGTYAKEMPNCVAFGAEFPGRDNAFHQNNEHILLEDLLDASAIYAKAIYDMIKS